MRPSLVHWVPRSTSFLPVDSAWAATYNVFGCRTTLIGPSRPILEFNYHEWGTDMRVAQRLSGGPGLGLRAWGFASPRGDPRAVSHRLRRMRRGLEGRQRQGHRQPHGSRPEGR